MYNIVLLKLTNFIKELLMFNLIYRITPTQNSFQTIRYQFNVFAKS